MAPSNWMRSRLDISPVELIEARDSTKNQKPSLAPPLTKHGTPLDKAFCSFPVILPEPDADIGKGLDEVVRSRSLLNKLDIAPEIGGWATILAYVRDGFGVGLSVKGP